jgi:uncharacterized membrane protein HdeD (DUF308 family)
MMFRLYGTLWWVTVLRGALAAVLGLIALFLPAVGLAVLVFLFGAYFLLDGLLNLRLTFGRGGTRSGKTLPGLVGALSVALGVAVFIWPEITALALLILVAAWAVITGIGEVAQAIQLRKHIANEWFLALGGAASVAFGLLLVIWPQAGLLALIWLVGIFFLLYGVLLAALGFKLKKHRGL